MCSVYREESLHNYYLRGNLIEAHDFLLEDEIMEKGRTERRKGKGGRKEGA